MIILDDADVDKAVELAHFALFFNQVCCCKYLYTHTPKKLFSGETVVMQKICFLLTGSVLLCWFPYICT